MKFADRKYGDLTPAIVQAELEESHQDQLDYEKTLRAIRRGLEAAADLGKAKPAAETEAAEEGEDDE